MGGLKKYLENGKSWGVGGSYVKFPPWLGYGYFLELHNCSKSGYLYLLDKLLSTYKCTQTNTFYPLDSDLSAG